MTISIDSSTQLSDLNAGQIVTFGRYHKKDVMTVEALEWRVLEVEDGKALLVTEQGIDCQTYNNEGTSITWENCSLREWLNSELIEELFTEEELSLIPFTSVTNTDNPHYLNQGKGGNNTKDRLFLLSLDEIRSYLPQKEERLLTPTEFALSEGVKVNEKGNSSWWLRSPGAIPFEASYIADDGSIMGLDLFCGKVDDGTRAVRVALYIKLASKKIDIKEAKAGDKVSFGTYPKDDTEKLLPITWRVLERKDNKVLLITDRSIDAKPYNMEERNTYSWMFSYSGNWSVSTLRKWLNHDFLKSAFSSEEAKKIAVTHLENKDSEKYGTLGGDDTDDKVFILSIEEARKYFPADEDRKAKVTKYARQNNAYADVKGCGYWWLRSVGQDQFDASYVDRDGQICEGGRLVYTQNHSLRIAIWVNV